LIFIVNGICSATTEAHANVLRLFTFPGAKVVIESIYLPRPYRLPAPFDPGSYPSNMPTNRYIEVISRLIQNQRLSTITLDIASKGPQGLTYGSW